MWQNYRLCQAVGQAPQTIPSYEKCKILKTNKMIYRLFQTIIEKSPKVF